MLKTTKLTKIYNQNSVIVKALVDIDIELKKGEILTIMGKSGSGKSTILKQIGLLDLPTSGSIEFDGKLVSKLSERERSKVRLNQIGYVFQEYALLPELSAVENVFLPSIMKSGYSSKNYQKALNLLKQVGLEARSKHLPKELSGGEQQRVAIARSLINDPILLLADEPCANLDTISSKIVMETFQKLNKDLGVTIIFVSHDPDDKKYSNRQIFLKDGKQVDSYF